MLGRWRAYSKMSACKSLEILPIILCRSKFPVVLAGKMAAQEGFSILGLFVYRMWRNRCKGQQKGSIISEGNWRDGILSTYQCRNSLLLTYFLETVIINCYLWKCKSKCNQLAAMVVAYYKSSKPQLTLWLICLIMNADVGTPSCSCYLPHLQSYLTFWLRFRLYFSNKWNTERESQESVCDIRVGMPFMMVFFFKRWLQMNLDFFHITSYLIAKICNFCYFD